MPAEDGRRATAARLFLRVRELLTTDGIQGQLLHSLHLSPLAPFADWGACGSCLIHAAGHAARRRQRRIPSRSGSTAAIATSLMLASRRLIKPSESNSHSSLP